MRNLQRIVGAMLVVISCVAPLSAMEDVNLERLTGPFAGLFPRPSTIQGWTVFPVIKPPDDPEALPFELPGQAEVTLDSARALYHDRPAGIIEQVYASYSVKEMAIWRGTANLTQVWATDFSVSVAEHLSAADLQYAQPTGVAPNKVVRMGDFACWTDTQARDEEALFISRGMFTVSVKFAMHPGMLREATRESMRELTLLWASRIVDRLAQPPNVAGVEITDGPSGDPNPVEAGGQVLCTVTARHSGNLPLTYKWTATGGRFDDPQVQTPIWTAPPAGAGAPAQYGITVTVRAADGTEVGASYLQQIGVPPDLLVEPGWIRLTYPKDNTFMEIERQADRQFVLVQVQNTHQTATARDVVVRISAGPRSEDGTYIGNPIPVGDVAPGQMKQVSTTWDLQGANIEDYRLYAHAYCLNSGDANPDDNYASIDIDGIYYAHNGTRAFSFATDTFSFKNFNIGDRGLAGLIDKHAALLAGGLDRTAPKRPLVDDPFHMLMYMRYEQYMVAFAKSGAGGLCHGFIHATKDHFENPATRPAAKDVSTLTVAEASPTITTYHSTQMLRLGPSMLTNTRYFSKSYGVASALQGAESALRGRRECIKISLAGYRQKADGTKLGRWGHAILGFKLIKVAGRDPVLYVYDPNLPFASPKVQSSRCMTQIYFRGNGFGMSPNMTAIYSQTAYTSGQRLRIYSDGIAAVPSLRDLNPAEVKATTTAANASIFAMSRWMQQSGLAGHMLRCPADAHFVDAQGRRTGIVGGQQVNEIPGAEIRMADDVEVYFLPTDRQYQVVIEGTGQGQARFASLRGLSDTRIGVTTFPDIPLQPGSRTVGTLAPGGQIASFAAGGASIAPRFNGFLDQDDPVWGGGTSAGGQGLTVTSPADGARVPEQFTVSGTCAPGQSVYVTATAEATLKATGQNATAPIVETAAATVGADGRWSIDVSARAVYRDNRVELKQINIAVESRANGAVVEQVNLIVRR